MSEKRECPVKGCITKHDRSKLMCYSHWRSLPRHLRDDLMRAYRQEGVISEAYLKAREACLAHCEGREPEPV